jgi:hypothetical protein
LFGRSNLLHVNGSRKLVECEENAAQQIAFSVRHPLKTKPYQNVPANFSLISLNLVAIAVMTKMKSPIGRKFDNFNGGWLNRLLKNPLAF